MADGAREASRENPNMKMFIILAAFAVTQNASATLFKCTLMSKTNNGTSTRLMTGYVDSSDDKDIVGGVKLSQIEINARNGSVQPFAAITAYKNGSKDVVIAQLMESKIQGDQIVNMRLSDLSEKTVAAVDSQGNSHQVNCFEAK